MMEASEYLNAEHDDHCITADEWGRQGTMRMGSRSTGSTSRLLLLY